MSAFTVSLLVFVAMTVANCAPTPGGWGGSHEHHIVHVPYHVHTVHHHHVKKIAYPVHHVEKVAVPVPYPVHHVEKVPVHVPIHYHHVEKIHVPVHHEEHVEKWW